MRATLFLTLASSLAILAVGCVPLPDRGGEGEKCFQNDTCFEGLVCREDGRCAPCTPDCSGRCEGADDGCGGTCSTVCPDGRYCATDKTCQICNYSCTGKCDGADDGCGGTCMQSCASGEYCEPVTKRCQSCNYDCAGKCGGADDGCGGTCLHCAAGEDCQVQTCVTCDLDTLCGPACADCTTGLGDWACIAGDHCGCVTEADCQTGELCVSGACAVCTPDCTARACGDDGCGGSCGDCGADECNTETGQCQTSGPPTIVSEDIGSALLPAGTHRTSFQITFSEPVTGLSTGGVSISAGAYATGFYSNDRITWHFTVLGIHSGGQYTLSLSDAIRDLSDTPLAPTQRLFSVESGSAIYVREGAFGDGSSPDTPTGDLVNVMVSAQPGDEILMAQGTFTTFMELTSGVSLFCGFNTNFTDRDPATYVSIIDQSQLYATLTLIGADDVHQRAVDGCTFRNNWGGGASLQPTIGLDLVGTGALITRNEIYTAGDFESIGVRVSGGSPLLAHNRVSSGTIPAGQSYTGLDLTGDGMSEVYHNTLIGGDGPGHAVGMAISGSTLHIEGNLIYGGNDTGASADNQGIGVIIDSCDPTLRNNLIHGGGYKAHTTGVLVINSQATLSNNTILAGQGTLSAAGVRTGEDEGHPSLTNNILFCDPARGHGLVEQADTLGTSDPVSVQNNLFIGCPAGLYLDEGVTALTSPAQIDALDGAAVEVAGCTAGVDCETARHSDNLTSSMTLAELFVDPDGADDLLATPADNDWHLKATEPAILQGGKMTYGFDCGTHESPTTCGLVGSNRDGRKRAPIDSVGAY